MRIDCTCGYESCAYGDQGRACGASEIGGKPFHGWSCECTDCEGYDEAGQPRPGEQATPDGPKQARCSSSVEPASGDTP